VVRDYLEASGSAEKGYQNVTGEDTVVVVMDEDEEDIELECKPTITT
jgi:hypothetical protein